MRQPLSIALAATIAVSAIGLAATPAAARDRHWQSNDGAAIAVFGAIATIAAIAAASQHRNDYYYGGYPPPPPRYHGYYYRGYSPHVQWCLDHYRTYNPATNTYYRQPGVPAVCYAPY